MYSRIRFKLHVGNVDEEHFMESTLTRADYMHERRTDSSGKSIR
jgi:hypothetical protein